MPNSKENKYYNLDDPKYTYNTLLNKALAIKKFGLFTYYFKEAKILFFEQPKINKEETVNYFKNSLSNKKNSHTGALKGDNVIIFLLESLEWFAIDPELTPTLFRLSNVGINYQQYYSKNKTNHSEAIAILGSFPTNENLLLDKEHLENYSKDSFAFSLPNLLKKDGVEITTYIHGFEADFYKRSASIPKYGFDNTIFLEDTKLPNKSTNFNDWIKDSDMIKENIHAIAPNTGKRFLSFYTTIITHGAYEENFRLKTYYKKLDKLRPMLKQENPHLYYYQAAVMDLDYGLEYLLNYLEENHLLSKTLLVLYSDHYSYYHNLSYKVKNIAPSDSANIEAHRVPMIMYSKKLGSEVNNNFTSSYNILPTVLDLLGIPYQINYYLGSSIFSDQIESDIFISKTGGIFNKSIYSSDGVTFQSPTQNELKPGQIETFRGKVSEIYAKQEQIDKIYQFDIFNPNNER